MTNPVKQYNDIMYTICHEHSTIGTRYSENTDGWNLRDMVSEMQYVLDIWTEKNSMPWRDAHDPYQPDDKSWYKNWVSEVAKMKRFINKYKDEAMQMECVVGHCSRFD